MDQRIMTFEEVKKDYLKLINEWGHPNDMTGSFVDAEKMEKVILNPSKKAAMEYMKEVIEYGFQTQDGHYHSEVYGKVPIANSVIVAYIYDKYIR